MSDDDVLIVKRTFHLVALDCIIQAAQYREACGYLLGVQGTRKVLGCRPMTNVADVAAYRYEMDPEEQLATLNELELRGLTPVAVYHSHINTGPEMSSNDIRYAAPDLLQLVYSVSEGRARLWEMHKTGGVPYPSELAFRLV